MTRVAAATLSFIIVAAVSQQATPPTQAGPEPAPEIPASLLPQSLGTSISSGDPVTISFASAMDRAATEAAVQVLPAQRVEMAWNADDTELSIRPAKRWRSGEGYLLVVARTAADAQGASLDAPLRYAFSTRSAPVVSDFQVRLAGAPEKDRPREREATLAADSRTPADPATKSPDETAKSVSASSTITVAFSARMDRDDVEEHFSIAPHVRGRLSWSGNDLVFTPKERLEPGARYTINVIGARDREGNPLGGEANFSFVVQAGAQLTRTAPKSGESGIEPGTVEMWFSQPMNVRATNRAFGLTDTSTGALVGGLLTWNDARTQLTYTPDAPFAGGRTFEVRLNRGARDADGNRLRTAWSFTTAAAPATPAPPATGSQTSTRSTPTVPPPAPATSLAGYALNQVNAARAAYGFAPLVLDASVSAAASAHAADQAHNGYFSHYSLDGRSREDRLRAAGVSFGWSGENQCYHVGMSQQATLDWCHAQFMAEPYPGHWNHIANILSPNARRMGVGIATVGGRTIITWNFTD